MELSSPETPPTPEIPPSDQLLASAVRFLIDGGEEAAASVLLSCSMDIRPFWVIDTNPYGGLWVADVTLRCPRAAYDVLEEDVGNHPVHHTAHPARTAVERAIDLVLPGAISHAIIDIRAEITEIDPDWRTELLEIARGKGVHNQAAQAGEARVWRNLRFRSESERRIAMALDRVGVLFFPNCKGRLNTPEGRRNREPDFLVCHGGKWGILEVDGEPFHPPSRTVHDHERDRLFRAHGISVVEHFDASECFENPDGVVRQFLGILGRA